MRIHNLLYLGFSLLLLASCASDNDSASDDNGGKAEYDGVTASVAPKKFEVSSRSSLTFDDTRGMVFSWNPAGESADELTILSDVDNSTRSIYRLNERYNNTTAHFDGGGFKLSPSARYYAFSKIERNNSTEDGYIRIPDKSNITVSYSGQRQIASGTGNTSHLGDYDFMAATATCDPNVEDQAHFSFEHLGFTLFITMTDLPANAKYRKLEIYDSKNVYRNPVRTIDLSKGLDATTGKYAPAFNPEDVQSEAYKSAPRFSLFLGQDTGNNKDNSDDEGIQVSTDRKLELFVELPPVDMRDNTFIFTLVPSDGGTPYYLTAADNYKKDYQAGWAYKITGKAQPIDKFNVRLRVNHDWQLGNAVSRATTGDPGNEDKYAKPKYIYYVFCVGGNVKEVNGAYFNKIETPDEAWKTSEDKVFDTYQKYNESTKKYEDEDAVLEFSVLDTEKDLDKNVYFVASMEELDETFKTTNINSGTKEDAIQALLYNITAKTSAETDAEYQTRSQSFLKNLYSTPWESQSTFIGALKDPYQDVILYHVAAKVDLKWNSSVMLPITGDNAFVKVNSVKATDLSLFKPTTNVYETGSYNVKAPIEEDTWLNGRQVFYLPQFANSDCTYNVKIGDKTAENVTFSPATTNGFTSWLRWLANFK